MKMKKLISGLTSAALSLSAFAGINISSDVANVKAAGGNWKFDLGGSGVASGYTGVSAKDAYSASKGYGFTSTGDVSNVAAKGSGAYSDAVQFNKASSNNVFKVDLPKGTYEVKVVTGNVSRTTINIEGIPQMINLTGNNAVETIKIPVTDGSLEVQAGAGKSGTAFSISAIEVTQINTTGDTPPTIWICGDSTVASYYNVSAASQHGWGQYLIDNIDSDYWHVRNLAASGQYAKGFIDAGQFKPVEKYGKKGDVYLIAIGINDSKYYDGAEYATYITDMVKKAKAKGVEVILVKQQGRRGDLQKKPLLSSRWFAGEMDQVGKAQGVEVMNLFKAWQDFGAGIGYNGMAEYYATKNDGTADDLHQSMKGAKKLAELVAKLHDFKAAGGTTTTPPTTNPPATNPPSSSLTAEVFDESVTYSFKNVNSGLYMEVAEAKAESGANVQQWGKNGNSTHNVWKLDSAGDGYYYIYSALSDKLALDVAGNKATNGQNVSIYNFNGNNNQQFKFTKNSDGSYKIRTKVSNDASAVEVESGSADAGANVQQWEVNGANCQDWIVEKASVNDAPATNPPATNPPATQPPVQNNVILGDANCDGLVSIADAAAIFQYLGNQDKYNLSAEGKINADVTGDGITVDDALFIQKYDAGIEKLPQYNPPATTTTATTAPPATNPPATTTAADSRLFAVDQTWTNGVTETANEGYTKAEGYVNLDNELNSEITFTANVPEKGNYHVHIRFANGSENDRKMKVYVNGDKNNYWMQSFTGTGAWTEWTEFGIVLPLNAGKNTIQFVSATTDGGPNFDYIKLTLTDEPYAEVYDPADEQKPVVSSKPTIFIAGDSTVQSYKASYAPQQGWGYYLQSYFNNNVTVSNQALAGRSTKKFYDEGRWDTIVNSLKEGDYVMIQFAINDAGKANADRYAPIGGNIDNPSKGTYEWYMTEFIKTAKAKGATPILVTTVIGMKAYSGGKFVNSYTTYCDACKKLSAKYDVPCIDLNSIMVKHYNSVGYNTAKSYHLMGAVSGSNDGTHFCEKGANIVAGLVAKDVKAQGLAGLAENLK
ncbi:MAG: RICIN domain-containing protein [Ruminococcus sp.]|nr:RICIN domain-containing protein [Ruminococcus sp.]